MYKYISKRKIGLYKISVFIGHKYPIVFFLILKQIKQIESKLQTQMDALRKIRYNELYLLYYICVG